MSQQPPGIPTVDVRETERRLREDARPPLVIDVREPDEHVGARLEDGAVLMPMSSFAEHMQELPKDRPLLVLCASGNRSAAVTAHLLRNGWTDVANVAGGITDWQKAGFPVRRGPVAPDEGAPG
jgi:rhodanese-related sulfurtransferase